MSDDVVNIYCNRGVHRQAREAVASFVRVGGAGRWSLEGPAEIDPRTQSDEPGHGGMVWLDGRGANSRRLPWPPLRSGERRAYVLRCPRCRLKVDALDERLQRALTDFHDEAVRTDRVFEDAEAPDFLRVRVARLALVALAAKLSPEAGRR